VVVPPYYPPGAYPVPAPYAVPVPYPVPVPVAPEEPVAPRPPQPYSPPTSAEGQEVTVVGVERTPGGVVLNTRDDAGRELAFDLADYTSVLGPDADRIPADSLRPDDRVAVSWFPQGDRRTLLMVRRLR
jgi:hypothetical protein